MSDTLLLNTSGAPISLLPLSTIPWTEAIRYMVLEKVTVLEWHENWIVHSRNWETKVPSVIMLKEYYNKKTHLRFSKMNVYLRDSYVCQYCGDDLKRKTATLDHVIPLSHGGKSTWENSTTACTKCNGAKGNKIGIKPRTEPYKPSYWALVEKRKKMRFDLKHPAWEQYMG